MNRSDEEFQKILVTVMYEGLVRYEYKHQIHPFHVQICPDQIEWDCTHQPRKTLFVLTVSKLG